MARTGTVEEGVGQLLGGQVVEAVPVREYGELVGVRVVVEHGPGHMVALTVAAELPLRNQIGVTVEHTRKTDSEGRWRTRRAGDRAVPSVPSIREILMMDREGTLTERFKGRRDG